MYTRLNLAKTNYKINCDWEILDKTTSTLATLDTIYKSYCAYKKFDSVLPLFKNELLNNQVIGYFQNAYDKDGFYTRKLIAFSVIVLLDEENVENIQFAWDYKDPNLRVGINSMETECAIYKELGYKYLYLGEEQEYFKQFDGYEELGPDARAI